jgi:uncharacterized protein YcnI
MIKKLITLSTTFTALLLTVPVLASAHVVVTPDQAGIGQALTFNVSVPNERQTPVVNLKLDIPKGITEVTPTVKPGWTITTTKDGNDITVITWSDGSIPVEQRDDFSFSAQVPGSPTELDWKAYQTYGDGTIVHWDQKPAGSDDSKGTAGPYSVTQVVDDLSKPATDSDTHATQLSIIALVLSVLAIAIAGYTVLKRRASSS